ncbi:hypothetical protein BH11BAC3_BH11BAC3_35420 [soil metagenome]
MRFELREMEHGLDGKYLTTLIILEMLFPDKISCSKDKFNQVKNRIRRCVKQTEGYTL